MEKIRVRLTELVQDCEKHFNEYETKQIRIILGNMHSFKGATDLFNFENELKKINRGYYILRDNSPIEPGDWEVNLGLIELEY